MNKNMTNKPNKAEVSSITIENSQKRVVNYWIFVLIVSVFSTIYGFMNFDINSFDGAIIMVSIFLFFSSIICIVIFSKRAKMLDVAIKEKTFIAHFKYDKTQWEDYIKDEYAKRAVKHKALFMVVAFMFILIFGLFILFIEEGRLAMFIIMVAFIALFAFIAYVLPLITYYFRKATSGEIIIMEKGVLLNKTFHNWNFPMSKLEKVKLIKKPYEIIEITYGFWDRTGPRSYTVNVPIPKNNKVDIDMIIKKLKDSNFNE